MPHSLLDRIITSLDDRLRARVKKRKSCRSSPAAAHPAVTLNAVDRRQSVGLMRVNHSGEVCAQALYAGQALMARGSKTRDALLQAGNEEYDHLSWCEERLQELQAQPSKLNRLWYGLSFSLGALVGAASDQISWGFVNAIEQQVGQHLRDSLARLPATDNRSKAVLELMLTEEEAHGKQALAAGGHDFPEVVKELMAGTAKVMTKSSYYI